MCSGLRPLPSKAQNPLPAPHALALLTHTVLYLPRDGTALGGSPHPHTALSCVHMAADLSCQLLVVTQVSAQRSPLQRGHPDPLSRRNPSSSLISPCIIFPAALITIEYVLFLYFCTCFLFLLPRSVPWPQGLELNPAQRRHLRNSY